MSPRLPRFFRPQTRPKPTSPLPHLPPPTNGQSLQPQIDFSRQKAGALWDFRGSSQLGRCPFSLSSRIRSSGLGLGYGCLGGGFGFGIGIGGFGCGFRMSCFSCFSSSGRRSKSINGRKDGSVNRAAARSVATPQAKSKEIHASKSPAEVETKKDTGNGNIAAQAFTFRELASATKNFRPECLLGEGGFGRVYKGRFENTGQVVAVKQLDRNGLQGNREFLVEVLMLSLLHHPNLVNLIGYCADGDQRLLVYEFMSLGSLEDHLLDLTPDMKPLSWYTRMRIATGAAKGLEYLHEKANPPVIYRDLKSSNILLNEEFNPKLSDFGLAKLGPGEDKVNVSSRVMGTYGYCAPEYARTGQLSLKSDVYSFGVVLLELITGRRAIDTSRPANEQNMVSWAQPMLKDQRRFTELADPLLEGNYPVRELNQAIAVAAMCLQEEPTVRPLMTDVVMTLSFLSAEPPSSQAPTTSNVVSTPPSNNSQPQENESHITQTNRDENSIERRRAVAEAIKWGEDSRNGKMSQRQDEPEEYNI